MLHWHRLAEQDCLAYLPISLNKDLHILMPDVAISSTSNAISVFLHLQTHRSFETLPTLQWSQVSVPFKYIYIIPVIFNTSLIRLPERSKLSDLRFSARITMSKRSDETSPWSLTSFLLNKLSKSSFLCSVHELCNLYHYNHLRCSSSRYSGDGNARDSWMPCSCLRLRPSVSPSALASSNMLYLPP